MNDSKPVMTDKEYVDDCGNTCPHCRGSDVDGGRFESDSDWASREVECNDCGQTWKEVFTLTGWNPD